MCVIFFLYYVDSVVFCFVVVVWDTVSLVVLTVLELRPSGLELRVPPALPPECWY